MLSHQEVVLLKKDQEGVALLEELCHQGWALKFQNLKPGPVSFPADAETSWTLTLWEPDLS